MWEEQKITELLQTKGERVSRGFVARIMLEKGLRSKVVKKYKATTNSKHSLPVAENLLNREFRAVRFNESRVDAKRLLTPHERIQCLIGGVILTFKRELKMRVLKRVYVDFCKAVHIPPIRARSGNSRFANTVLLDAF